MYDLYGRDEGMKIRKDMDKLIDRQKKITFFTLEDITLFSIEKSHWLITYSPQTTMSRQVLHFTRHVYMYSSGMCPSSFQTIHNSLKGHGRFFRKVDNLCLRQLIIFKTTKDKTSFSIQLFSQYR